MQIKFKRKVTVGGEIMPPKMTQSGVSNPRPVGCVWPGVAVNVAQHKIVNVLKTFFLLVSFC